MPFVLSACTAPSAPSPTAAPAQQQQATAAPAGAATAAKPAAATGEPVQLRFAWWGSQDRHDRTIKAIQLFQQQHPNITITYEFAGFQDYWTKMTTQASGGNLPDLMQQDYAYISQWTANNLIIPLDDYVNSGAINLSDVPKSSVDGGRINGKLIAVNLGNNSQTIALDVGAFEKAGVPLPQQNWSWDDFESTVMQLHQKLGTWGAGSGLSDIQLWKSLYLGYGGWAFTPDGKALGYSDDQKYIDYLKMLMRLQDAGAIPSQQEDIAQYRTASVESTPIVPGKAAMQYFWSNQLVAAWTAAGADRKFQLTHLPRPKGGQSENYLKPSQFISITSQSKHPKEAAMFIDFITNDVEANKILLGERGVPISPKIQEAIKPLLTPAQTETQNYLSRVEKDNSPLPPPDPATQSKLNDSIFLPQLVDAVLLKQAAPEAAVSQFRKDASSLLASG
ncbi:MAG TPA: extracellular solute-binding protein [Chloroflexota bacterium]|nr:extracellular solute-binding protein [Chloroflexota bacterium]